MRCSALSAAPLFCSHITVPYLSFFFLQLLPYCCLGSRVPCLPWKKNKIKKKIIDLTLPSCDLVSSFHLSRVGRCKCNVETRRAKFTPCHWCSKDNFLRSRHLSKLISWLNSSFHSLDPWTPYTWVLSSTCLMHWVVLLCLENLVVYLYKDGCMSPM